MRREEEEEERRRRRRRRGEEELGTHFLRSRGWLSPSLITPMK